MVPVVASVIVGTFTGVRYIVSLTETINQNQAAIEKIQKTDLKIKSDTLLEYKKIKAIYC